MDTKRFVSSFVNVTLTRQTCGQRSNRAAESKRRAIGNYFPERNCYMFLISKCRWDQDLCLCTTSVLAFGEPQRNGKFRENNVFWRRKTLILPLRCGFPNASTEVVYSPRSRSPLHFDFWNIQQIRSENPFPITRRLLSAALLERWPQVFPRQDHVYKTTDESFRFHNKNFDEIRCKLDSTENPRSFEKYPTPP